MRMCLANWRSSYSCGLAAETTVDSATRRNLTVTSFHLYASSFPVFLSMFMSMFLHLHSFFSARPFVTFSCSYEVHSFRSCPVTHAQPISAIYFYYPLWSTVAYIFFSRTISRFSLSPQSLALIFQSLELVGWLIFFFQYLSTKCIWVFLSTFSSSSSLPLFVSLCLSIRSVSQS